MTKLYDEVEWFGHVVHDLMDLIEAGKVTRKSEIAFIHQMTDKINQYGREAYMSPGQRKWLNNLYERHTS